MKLDYKKTIKIGIHKIRDREYYAVKDGNNPGVYITREQAEANAKGNVRKFKDYDSAYNYAWEDISKLYVYGEFNVQHQVYGYGYVLDTPKGKNKGTLELKEWGSEEDLIKYGNATGSLIAATKGMEKAIKMGIKELNIYYEYKGIHEFINISDKMLSYIGKEYRGNYISKIQPKLKVNFVKHDNYMNLDEFKRAKELTKESIEDYINESVLIDRIKNGIYRDKLDVYLNNKEKINTDFPQMRMSFDFSKVQIKENNKDLKVNVPTTLINYEEEESIVVNHTIKDINPNLHVLRNQDTLLGIGDINTMTRLSQELRQVDIYEIIPYTECINFNHERSYIMEFGGEYIEATMGLMRRINNLQRMEQNELAI